MIYVTGDTHGFSDRLSEDRIPAGHGDHLIICGDFGFIFYGNEKEAVKLKALTEKPYTICFCDGNHENFDLLEKYPVVDFCGGKAHKIAENIYHLMRGEMFEIEGKRIFTFGGAFSTDRGGREDGVSYWHQELSNDEERKNAIVNLNKAGMECDCVITHTAPTYIIGLIYSDPELRDITGLAYPGPHPKEKSHDEFLNWIYDDVKFKKWYFGHWHIDKAITDKVTAVYDTVYKI